MRAQADARSTTRRWVRRGLLAVIVAGVGLVAGCGNGDHARPARSDAPPPLAGTVVRAEIGFRSIDRLDAHYSEHVREFGAISRTQYLRLAQTLRDGPAGGSVLQVVRRDGTITRYDRDTGAFIAFDRGGVIRTFFRPNDGERYFRRQARR